MDRGLAYGDGLFETIAVYRGRPLRWPAHWARLSAGCARLGIALPPQRCFRDEIDQLARAADRAVIKLVVTRGTGGRGYALPARPRSRRVVIRFPWPVYREGALRLRVCGTRLGIQPALAGIKHLCRLEQVLARAEWGDEYDEGILLDTEGAVVECVAANLFLWEQGVLRTPRLDRAGVAGVMRAAVLEAAAALGIPVREDRFGLEAVQRAEGLLVTNAVTGPRWVRRVEGWRYARPSCLDALCARLADAERGVST